MRKIPLIILLLLLYYGAASAQKYTVSGYVADGLSGEKLIGARVYDAQRNVGTLTNNYGFFSLTLDGGPLALQCSYVGFKPFATRLELGSDTTLHIDLVAEGVQLEAVEITSEKDIADDVQMSTIDVPIETIKKIPALMGEVDVIKALQLLPGVRSGGEGSSGFYVRGGGPDQNLILLDGVPVYNVTHLFGFFSVFPADAISNVSLVKGGFPARYGGRLSSVIDISLKDGHMKKLHGEGSVGLIASKITLEGPIWKDKTSFMVSARRTYIDVLAQPIIRQASGTPGLQGYYFYDGIAKVNHRFNDRNRLYLSFYGGNDKFYSNLKYEDSDPSSSYTSLSKSRLGWGNKIAALRWNHLFNDKLFGNLAATYSTFHFGVGNDQTTTLSFPGFSSTDRFAYSYDSGIRDLGLKADLDWYATPRHLVRFGGYGTRHKFMTGASRLIAESPDYKFDTVLGIDPIFATEAGLYLEDDFKVGNRQKINLGVHGSALWVGGQFYRSLQPRIAYRLMINSNWAAKASFTTMYQYIHLLTNSSVGLPTDLWVPSTASIKPQMSYQGAAGIARSFKDLGLELSVEGYYKYMTGLIEYQEGASFLSATTDWQKKVVQGNGWAYGSEFFLQKKIGKTSGWVGYTLSWTKRQFEELNDGKPFFFKYDRRHDISVVIVHEFNKKVDCGLTWVYGSGQATTLPRATFQGLGNNPTQPGGFPIPVDYYGERNGYRLHDYHRLDLSVNLNKEREKFTRTWSFSIYNVYSRRNPYFLYFDYTRTGQRVLKQVSLFPIIPSVAYRFKF
jgi:TonB-dependent Receptor Plug Domain/CarboxypepD_reg-like domain